MECRVDYDLHALVDGGIVGEDLCDVDLVSVGGGAGGVPRSQDAIVYWLQPTIGQIDLGVADPRVAAHRQNSDAIAGKIRRRNCSSDGYWSATRDAGSKRRWICDHQAIE